VVANIGTMPESREPELLSPDVVSDGVPPEASAGGHAHAGGSVSSNGAEGDSAAAAPGDEADDEAEIESPAKLIRIGGMIKQLLDEVHTTSLDEPAREQLRDIYENSIAELRSAMSSELGEELDRLTLDFGEDSVPTEAQLRIAKAQLVGWLEGLFHGIQASLMAQQLAARNQIEMQMRGQLPPGAAQPGQGGQMSMPGSGGRPVDGWSADGRPAGGPGYI